MKTHFIFILCNLLFFTTFSQTPGGLNSATVGLGFWSKANTQIAGKIVLNGSNVASWSDENSTYTTSQATPLKQPAFINYLTPISNFNFNPCIDFTGANTTTLLNGVPQTGLNSNNMTALIVCNSNINNGTTFGYASGTNKVQFKCHWRVQNGISGIGYVANTNVLPATGFACPLFGDSVARIVTMHGMGSTFNARMNAQIFPMVLNATTYNPAVSTGMSIGCSGTVQYVDDDIAEIIMYNTKLSLADLNKVETYLSIKYGTTFITKQNYTLANNFVLWDTIIDAPYYYNLTAIGKENASGLNQKQSFSVNYKGMIEMYNNSVSTFPTMNDLNNTTFNDNDFLMIGDNDSSNNLTSCIDNNYISRIGKIWKVHTTPTYTGTATLRVLKSSLPISIKNLIVSTTPNFSTGTNTIVPLNSSGNYFYVSKAFQNNTYFTFATDSIKVNYSTTAATCSSANGIEIVTATNGASPYTYTWSNSTTNTTNIKNDFLPGNYSVIVGHGPNGICQITKSFTINDSALMNFTAIVTNPKCFGNKGTIQLNGTVGINPFTYTLINNGTINNNGLFQNLNAGTFTFNIKDGAGCSKDTTISIISPTEIIYDTTISPTCWNENTGYLFVPTSGGTPPYTYSFDNAIPNSTNQYLNLNSGIHTIKITDANNCTKSFSITIPTYNSFTITESSTPATCAEPNSASISLEVNNGNSPYTYTWLNTSSSSSTITNLSAGTYSVNISDANDCNETHTYVAENNCCTAWFPNAFTPNNDSKNDEFVPHYSSSINDLDLKIVDRWGEVVFHTKDKTKTWDGNFNGRFCEIGTYFYILKASCGFKKIEYKGDISLIR